MGVDDLEVGADFGGALVEDFHGGRGLGGGKGGGVGLHDAGFVPGDFFDGGAEDGGVVDAEAGDAGDGGADEDVGAVVFAADAAFNDGCVDAFGHVGVECHEGEEAEVDGFGAGVCGLPGGACGVFEAVPYLEKVLCEDFF